MAASLGFGQFDIDANAIARPAHATLEKITCIEQAPDLGRRDTPTFELEARRFSRNKQVRKAAERRDDVLGDPVAKIILARIVRQVLERQHRHHGTPGEAARRGEGGDFGSVARRGKRQQFPTDACVKRPGNQTGGDECGAARDGGESWPA